MRFWVWIILLAAIACKEKKANDVGTQSEVYLDKEYNQKFEMYDPGFTGGDATYSVDLPDGRTVWIFGDTFIGPVTPELSREKTDPMYIRNCFVVQDGDQMITRHLGKPEEFKSMIIPQEVTELDTLNERDVWYWPGDAFVSNDTLKLFLSKFHQADTGMWGFKFIETELVEFLLPEIKQVKISKIGYTKDPEIHYGHAVCETDDFLYIYGRGNGQLYAARAAWDDVVSSWEFFNGVGWSSNPADAKPMADMEGSEQFSVFELNDQYVLLTQLGSLSKEVISLVSQTPYGPWQNKKSLFHTPIPFDNKELFTYNAMAHPQFTENDELLVSYNTNSFQLADHFVNAAIYRPRFVRVPITMVLEK